MSMICRSLCIAFIQHLGHIVPLTLVYQARAKLLIQRLYPRLRLLVCIKRQTKYDNKKEDQTLASNAPPTDNFLAFSRSFSIMIPASAHTSPQIPPYLTSIQKWGPPSGSLPLRTSRSQGQLEMSLLMRNVVVSSS